MPIVRFPNQNYELDHDSALDRQDWGRNVSIVYARTIVRKRTGTGFAGSDGWFVRSDSSVGGDPDLTNQSGGSWSFQNGQNTGEWWYHSGTFEVGHDGNGFAGYWTNARARFGTSVGEAFAETGYRDLPRIPKRPSEPGTPTFSEIQPTSVRVSWGGSGDNRGSGIDNYLVRYWPNNQPTGSYTDVLVGVNYSTVIGNLTPGKEYYFVIYAHNGAADNNGFSNASGGAVVRTLSGAWVRFNNAWRRAIPYIKLNGVWRMAQPFIKHNGTWKRGM